MAQWRPAGAENDPREVTVWCSNDYLGMGGHPDVIEAAVVARPDPRWGERPVAFVTTERADLSERELTEFVRERLAHFKAPDQVYFQTLPKTSTGKIQKNVLRERARDLVHDQAQSDAGPAGER